MRTIHPRNSRKTKVIAGTLLSTLLFWLSIAPPLRAQESKSAGEKRQTVTRVIQGRTVTLEQPTIIEPTEANFNNYRSDLLTILTAQRATLVLMHLDDLVARADSAIQQTQAMSLSDFGENYPGFPDLTALKSAVLGQQSAMAQAFANGGTRVAQFAPGDPFPPTVYASFCPLNPQAPEVAFTSGLVLLAAELVKDIALDACNEVIEAIGFGGNASLVCIVTDIVYAVARGIDYAIQACQIDTGAVAPTGAIFNRLEYIHNQLDYSIANDNANKAMLSTQLANAENHVVSNDNNNKAALSSQSGSFQTLATRMAIEANLAEDPTSFSGAGLFETPASQGGYLEVARQILIDSYNAHVAAAGAGVTVYNPSNELSLGATFTAQGKYREAYYYYRKGYRSVVKYP